MQSRHAEGLRNPTPPKGERGETDLPVRQLEQVTIQGQSLFSLGITLHYTVVTQKKL